jgi:hypothetical protein
MIPPIVHQGKPLGVVADNLGRHSESLGSFFEAAGFSRLRSQTAPAAILESGRGKWQSNGSGVVGPLLYGAPRFSIDSMGKPGGLHANWQN